MRKEATFLVLCFATTLAGVIGPVLVPAFVALIPTLNQPLDKIAWINVALVLTIGFGSYLFAAMAAKYGQRPALLLALLASFVACVWAGATPDTNYNSLIGARALQGLGMGALFNNVPGCIQDMYFVHQRGFRVAL